MEKSAEAFRTISEVADLLETPAHVLRFWESRFPQIRPVKRAGGRRYYRPSDIALLTGIKRLLHDDGLTIRGVQKVLREQGIRYVSDLPPQTGRPPRAPLRMVTAAADATGKTETGPAAEVAQPAPEAPGADRVADPSGPPAPAPAPAATAETVPAEPRPTGDTVRADPLPLWTAADPAPPAVPSAAPAAPPPPVATVSPPDVSPADEAPSAAAAPPSGASPADPHPLAVSAPRSDATQADDGIWLAARLRALSPASAAARRAELAALHDRLAALRDRLAVPPGRPRP